MRAETIKRHLTKNAWLKFICIAGSFALCCFIVLISTSPETHTIKQGEISPETITAPRDFVDEEATDKLIEEEKAKVGPVYNLDESITQESLDSVAEDIAKLEQARAYAQQYYINAQIPVLQTAENQRVQSEINAMDPKASLAPLPTPATITAENVPFDPGSIQWESVLPAEEQTKIQNMLPSFATNTDWLTVVSMSKDTLAETGDVLYRVCQEKLTAGYEEDNSETIISEIVLRVSEQTLLTVQSSRMITECLQQDLKPNIVFDQEATRLKQEEAANAVIAVKYMKGQNIVLAGEVVTPEQYNVLDRLGLLDQSDTAIDSMLSAMLYIIVVYGGYILYVIFDQRRLADNIKSIAILSILTVLAMAVTAILAHLAPSLLVSFMAVILVAILLNIRQSLSYAIFISLLLATVFSTQQEIFTEATFIKVVITITGSIFAVAVLKKVSFRAGVILAGLLSSIPGILIEIVLFKSSVLSLTEMWTNMAWLVLSGVTCGVVAIGLLPAMESIFKVTTPAKLLELSDPNHPLLKRLMMEAPGTYHHSLFVGNLAEVGCQATGGNALLARVGAYYHDVGKLKNPSFFVENQWNNINPHDEIEPAQSVKIIIEHVAEGLDLLSKYKFPSEIRRILLQHHGDSAVAYFYHKAKQIEGKTDIKDYRYPCPKPDTKESAIVLLADTVEAAMRTLDDPNADVYDSIEKLIRAKYDDGQMDMTPLTRRDMTMIARSFASVYKGMLHNRIKYPKINANEETDEDTPV